FLDEIFLPECPALLMRPIMRPIFWSLTQAQCMLLHHSGGLREWAIPQDGETIQRMCDAIVHRGPDDEGVYLHEGAGLGIRRLSIIDLPGGHQPIHNEDRNIWLVFNGEIYNFSELRLQLEARGHRFYTESDTEVIV